MIDTKEFTEKWINRIEPHPIGESNFTKMNPFANEIQESGIEITFD